MKTSKKIISLLLSAAIIMSAMVITAVSAAAAADGSEVYFDNSVFNWENVYIYAYGTKENAKWPGQLMSATDDGLYKASFTSAYKSESIIFNNGKEKDEGKEQYPKASGLSLKAGQCKLLTAAKQWVDYGKPDSHGYGIVYKASGTSFSSEFLQVQLGLKNASVGYYSVDGSAKKSYTDGTIIKIGEGKIGNSEITLVLTATSDLRLSLTTKHLQQAKQLFLLTRTDTQQLPKAAITEQTRICSWVNTRQFLLTAM